MAVAKATHFGLTALTAYGREEADMLATVAQALVVIVRAGFIQLIQTVLRQTDLIAHVPDAHRQKFIS